MSGDVEIGRDGRVQILRLTRPAKKNALTSEMYAALSDALEAGDAASDVGVHMICGSGGVFCAGNDLADFIKVAKGDASANREGVRFIRLLPRVRKPLVAAVDGVAVGVGTTLLFHCDLVYASPSAVFSTPFLDLGLVPEAASSLLMPRMIGPHRAFELLVLGETYTAERAHAAGFVNAILPSSGLEAGALKACQRLAAKPPEALAIARRMIRGDAKQILARTDEELLAFAERLKSPEALAAFQAFFR